MPELSDDEITTLATRLINSGQLVDAASAIEKISPSRQSRATIALLWARVGGLDHAWTAPGLTMSRDDAATSICEIALCAFQLGQYDVARKICKFLKESPTVVSITNSILRMCSQEEKYYIGSKGGETSATKKVIARLLGLDKPIPEKSKLEGGFYALLADTKGAFFQSKLEQCQLLLADCCSHSQVFANLLNTVDVVYMLERCDMHALANDLQQGMEGDTTSAWQIIATMKRHLARGEHEDAIALALRLKDTEGVVGRMATETVILSTAHTNQFEKANKFYLEHLKKYPDDLKILYFGLTRLSLSSLERNNVLQTVNSGQKPTRTNLNSFLAAFE